MADNPRLAIALAHARRGREVFPFELGAELGGRRPKTPKVKWTEAATTDEDQIRAWWRRWPLAWPGWKLPPGWVVLDVDDPAAFEAAGLDLDTSTASQQTPRGGYHLLFHHDLNREVRQTAKEVPGADTRVGGKGWVGLYAVDSFSAPAQGAPEWLYGARDASQSSAEHVDPLDEEMGTRDEILRWVGTLRRARMTGPEILAALVAAQEEGRIVDLDEARPWELEHFEAIAREADKWKPGVDTSWLEASLDALNRFRDRTRPGRLPPEPAVEGLIVPIDDYRAGVPKDIPWVAAPFLYQGGVTLLSGPPKGGKSTLMANLQRALEEGGEFLGVRVDKHPALLVTEEGGVAVVYKAGGLHFLEVLDRRAAVLAGLNYGQVLAAIAGWCESRPRAVVFVDTLAVWAGLEDENSSTQVTKALDLVTQLAGETGAAIVLVHHTRKGGGENGEQIRGSSAIFASVDIALTLSNEKNGDKTDRSLDVQGRVVLPQTLSLAFDEETSAYRVHNVYETARDPLDDYLGKAHHKVGRLLREAHLEGRMMTLAELAEAMPRVSASTIRQAVMALAKDKRLRVVVDKEGENRRSTPRYSMPPAFHMEGDPSHD